MLYYAFVTTPGEVSTATGGIFRFDEIKIRWDRWDHATGTWIPDSRLIDYTMGDETRDVVRVPEGQAMAIAGHPTAQ